MYYKKAKGKAYPNTFYTKSCNLYIFQTFGICKCHLSSVDYLLLHPQHYNPSKTLPQQGELEQVKQWFFP
jgi:hypothetical protein